MNQENQPPRVELTKRPFSPHYHQLKKILTDADVLLVPTDRDLAPTDHHNDEVEPA